MGPIQTENKRKLRFTPMKQESDEGSSRRKSQTESRDQNMEEEQEPSIYIFNLADDVNETQLYHLFGPFGAIKNVTLMRDSTTNQSKGYGFVTMKNFNEAEYAIDILNGYGIKNRPMKVSFKGAKNTNEDPMGEPGAWQIYVFNLSPDTIENDLWKLFAQFGAVKSVSIVEDPQTNKSKGFAFITMKNFNEASRAISSLNGFKLHSRNLKVSFKGQRPDDGDGADGVSGRQNTDQIQSVPIYVNFLPNDVEDGTVWKLFSQFGAIKDVNIVRDPESKKCLGYAFVNMKNFDDANIAINSLNGFEINGKRLHVSLKSKKVNK